MKEKIFNGIRYITSIPIAYLASRLFFIVSKFFGTHTGIISSHWSGVYGLGPIEIFLLDNVVCTYIFVYIIRKIVPKGKTLFSIIGSVMYSPGAIIPLYWIFINYNNIQADEDLTSIIIGALLILITLVVSNIYCAVCKE